MPPEPSGPAGGRHGGTRPGRPRRVGHRPARRHPRGARGEPGARRRAAAGVGRRTVSQQRRRRRVERSPGRSGAGPPLVVGRLGARPAPSAGWRRHSGAATGLVAHCSRRSNSPSAVNGGISAGTGSRRRRTGPPRASAVAVRGMPAAPGPDPQRRRITRPASGSRGRSAGPGPDRTGPVVTAEARCRPERWRRAPPGAVPGAGGPAGTRWSGRRPGPERAGPTRRGDATAGRPWPGHDQGGARHHALPVGPVPVVGASAATATAG